MLTRTLPVRLLALSVAFTFILTNHTLLPVSMAEGAETSPINTEATGVPANLSDLKIPSNIGTVEEIFQGDKDRVVFMVQDAHGIPEAQRNIRNLIDFFQKTCGLRVVAIEGAASQLNAQIFRSFPDKEVLKTVFKDYLNRGELTGPTMAAVFNDNSAHYAGLEDWPLYELGYADFLKALQSGSAAGFLDAWEKDLAGRKSQAYSPGLLEIDRTLGEFEKSQLDLIRVLKKLSSFKRPPTGSELALILEESEKDGGADLPLEIEVKQIADQVERHLKSQKPSASQKKKLAAFQGKFQEFRTSAVTSVDFAVFLKGLTAGEKKLGVRFSGGLRRMMIRHRKLCDIEGTRFFEEFEAYAASVKESVFKNDNERMLDRESRNLFLSRKMAALELTLKQWLEFKQEILNQPRAADAYGKLLEVLTPHTAFYRNAEERDIALFRNLNSLFGRKELFLAAAGNFKESVAMVSGGFHSEGIIRQLKENGISYVLMRPEITSVPPDVLYKDHMRGQVSWKKYFEVENGAIDVYKAFVRGTRDRLLSQSGPDTGKTLKAWRDRILLDLAAQGRLTEAVQYTRFLDEVASGDVPLPEEIRVLDDVENFIDGLRVLEATGRLDEQNIMALLKPSTIADLTAGALGAGDRWHFQYDAARGLFLPTEVIQDLAHSAARPELRGTEGRYRSMNDDAEAAMAGYVDQLEQMEQLTEAMIRDKQTRIQDFRQAAERARELAPAIRDTQEIDRYERLGLTEQYHEARLLWVNNLRAYSEAVLDGGTRLLGLMEAHGESVEQVEAYLKAAEETLELYFFHDQEIIELIDESGGALARDLTVLKGDIVGLQRQLTSVRDRVRDWLQKEKNRLLMGETVTLNAAGKTTDEFVGMVDRADLKFEEVVDIQTTDGRIFEKVVIRRTERQAEGNVFGPSSLHVLFIRPGDYGNFIDVKAADISRITMPANEARKSMASRSELREGDSDFFNDIEQKIILLLALPPAGEIPAPDTVDLGELPSAVHRVYRTIASEGEDFREMTEKRPLVIRSFGNRMAEAGYYFDGLIPSADDSADTRRKKIERMAKADLTARFDVLILEMVRLRSQFSREIRGMEAMVNKDLLRRLTAEDDAEVPMAPGSPDFQDFVFILKRDAKRNLGEQMDQLQISLEGILERGRDISADELIRQINGVLPGGVQTVPGMSPGGEALMSSAHEPGFTLSRTPAFDAAQTEINEMTYGAPYRQIVRNMRWVLHEHQRGQEAPHLRVTAEWRQEEDSGAAVLWIQLDDLYPIEVFMRADAGSPAEQFSEQLNRWQRSFNQATRVHHIQARPLDSSERFTVVLERPVDGRAGSPMERIELELPERERDESLPEAFVAALQSALTAPNTESVPLLAADLKPLAPDQEDLKALFEGEGYPFQIRMEGFLAPGPDLRNDPRFTTVIFIGESVENNPSRGEGWVRVAYRLVVDGGEVRHDEDARIYVEHSPSGHVEVSTDVNSTRNRVFRDVFGNYARVDRFQNMLSDFRDEFKRKSRSELRLPDERGEMKLIMAEVIAGARETMVSDEEAEGLLEAIQTPAYWEEQLRGGDLSLAMALIEGAMTAADGYGGTQDALRRLSNIEFALQFEDMAVRSELRSFFEEKGYTREELSRLSIYALGRLYEDYTLSSGLHKLQMPDRYDMPLPSHLKALREKVVPDLVRQFGISQSKAEEVFKLLRYKPNMLMGDGGLQLMYDGPWDDVFEAFGLGQGAVVRFDETSRWKGTYRVADMRRIKYGTSPTVEFVSVSGEGEDVAFYHETVAGMLAGQRLRVVRKEPAAEVSAAAQAAGEQGESPRAIESAESHVKHRIEVMQHFYPQAHEIQPILSAAILHLDRQDYEAAWDLLTAVSDIVTREYNRYAVPSIIAADVELPNLEESIEMIQEGRGEELREILDAITPSATYGAPVRMIREIRERLSGLLSQQLHLRSDQAVIREAMRFVDFQRRQPIDALSPRTMEDLEELLLRYYVVRDYSESDALRAHVRRVLSFMDLVAQRPVLRDGIGVAYEDLDQPDGEGMMIQEASRLLTEMLPLTNTEVVDQFVIPRGGEKFDVRSVEQMREIVRAGLIGQAFFGERRDLAERLRYFFEDSTVTRMMNMIVIQEDGKILRDGEGEMKVIGEEDGLSEQIGREFSIETDKARVEAAGMDLDEAVGLQLDLWMKRNVPEAIRGQVTARQIERRDGARAGFVATAFKIETARSEMRTDAAMVRTFGSAQEAIDVYERAGGTNRIGLDLAGLSKGSIDDALASLVDLADIPERWVDTVILIRLEQDQAAAFERVASWAKLLPFPVLYLIPQKLAEKTGDLGKFLAAKDRVFIEPQSSSNELKRVLREISGGRIAVELKVPFSIEDFVAVFGNPAALSANMNEDIVQALAKEWDIADLELVKRRMNNALRVYYNFERIRAHGRASYRDYETANQGAGFERILDEGAEQTHNSFYRNEVDTMISGGNVLIAEIDGIDEAFVRTDIKAGAAFLVRRRNPKWKDRLTLNDIKEGQAKAFLEALLSGQLRNLEEKRDVYLQALGLPEEAESRIERMKARLLQILAEVGSLDEAQVRRRFGALKINTVAQPWAVLQAEAALYDGQANQTARRQRLYGLQTDSVGTVLGAISDLGLLEVLRDGNAQEKRDALVKILRRINAVWRINNPWSGFDYALLRLPFDAKENQGIGVDEVMKDAVVLKAILEMLSRAVNEGRVQLSEQVTQGIRRSFENGLGQALTDLVNPDQLTQAIQENRVPDEFSKPESRVPETIEEFVEVFGSAGAIDANINHDIIAALAAEWNEPDLETVKNRIRSALEVYQNLERLRNQARQTFSEFEAQNVEAGKRATLERAAEQTHNSFYRGEVDTMISGGNVLIAEIDGIDEEFISPATSAGAAFLSRRSNPKWKGRLTLNDIKDGQGKSFLEVLLLTQLENLEKKEGIYLQSLGLPEEANRRIEGMRTRIREILDGMESLEETQIRDRFGALKINTVAQPWAVLQAEAGLYDGEANQTVRRQRLYILQTDSVGAVIAAMSYPRIVDILKTGDELDRRNMLINILRLVNAVWRLNNPWGGFIRDRLQHLPFALGEDGGIGIEDILKDAVVLRAILGVLNEAIRSGDVIWDEAVQDGIRQAFDDNGLQSSLDDLVDRQKLAAAVKENGIDEDFTGATVELNAAVVREDLSGLLLSRDDIELDESGEEIGPIVVLEGTWREDAEFTNKFRRLLDLAVSFGVIGGYTWQYAEADHSGVQMQPALSDWDDFHDFLRGGFVLARLGLSEHLEPRTKEVMKSGEPESLEPRYALPARAEIRLPEDIEGSLSVPGNQSRGEMREAEVAVTGLAGVANPEAVAEQVVAQLFNRSEALPGIEEMARSLRDSVVTIGVNELAQIIRMKALERLQAVSGQTDISAAMVQGFVNILMEAVITQLKDEGSMVVGIHLDPDTGEMSLSAYREALSLMRENVARVILTGAGSLAGRVSGDLRESGLPATTQGSLNHLRPHSLPPVQQGVPVLSKGDIPADLSNEILVGIGVSETLGTQPDPMLEVAETVLQLAIGLLLAKEDPKALTNAARIKEIKKVLFSKILLSVPSALTQELVDKTIQFEGMRAVSVSRSALMAFMTDIKVRQYLEQSA